MKVIVRVNDKLYEVEIGDLPDETPLATKIALYRIIQEGLTNAWRHADGLGQCVRANVENESIRLEIIDSGPGFDAASMIGKEDHLGLVGIRERVESLGGSFQIESGTDGTCLIALLPLRSQGEFDA